MTIATARADKASRSTRSEERGERSRRLPFAESRQGVEFALGVKSKGWGTMGPPKRLEGLGGNAYWRFADNSRGVPRRRRNSTPVRGLREKLASRDRAPGGGKNQGCLRMASHFDQQTFYFGWLFDFKRLPFFAPSSTLVFLSPLLSLVDYHCVDCSHRRRNLADCKSSFEIKAYL